MKTIKNNLVNGVVIACFGACLLVFSGCSPEPIPHANEASDDLITVNSLATRASGPSASGHGTVSLENTPLMGDGFRQFSFHAREKKNGTVSGSGVLTYQGGQLNVKYDIDCLTIIGNRAIMTGSIKQWKDNPDAEGQLIIFEVVDNGEGNNAAPDQISLVSRGTDPEVFDCAIDYNLGKYDIEGGNIQIH